MGRYIYFYFVAFPDRIVKIAPFFWRKMYSHGTMKGNIMEKNVLLTIEYDGANFHGWQRQPDKLTVQGALEKLLSKLLKTEILLNGTSRTDAGVHAFGQRASFKADVRIPMEKFALVINNTLASKEKGPYALSPIRIVAAEEKPMDFHARFDSKGKKYIYKICNTGQISSFNRNYVYHVTKPLDIDAMKKAAELIVGTHDFKCFEASGSDVRESTVRTIYNLEIMPGDVAGNIELHVSGDGFLYNMVRIITGTLVDVGHGKIAPEDIEEIINSKDRTKAGHTAPPYGLYLAEVYY